MSIFSARDAQAIEAALATLERDVEMTLEVGPVATPVTVLSAGGRELDACAEATQIAEGVAALSRRIQLEVIEHDEPGPWPQITIGPGLVYRGAPLGFELTAFVYAIVEAGRALPSLGDAARTELATLTRPVDVRVYVTPT